MVERSTKCRGLLQLDWSCGHELTLGKTANQRDQRPVEALLGENRLAEPEEMWEAHGHRPTEQGLRGPTSGTHLLCLLHSSPNNY